MIDTLNTAQNFCDYWLGKNVTLHVPGKKIHKIDKSAAMVKNLSLISGQSFREWWRKPEKSPIFSNQTDINVQQ